MGIRRINHILLEGSFETPATERAWPFGTHFGTSQKLRASKLRYSEMRFGGKAPARAFRRRITCCEHWLPSTAGEVGDGPDQGHSGGADSVPPAPNSKAALDWHEFNDPRSLRFQFGRESKANQSIVNGLQAFFVEKLALLKEGVTCPHKRHTRALRSG